MRDFALVRNLLAEGANPNQRWPAPFRTPVLVHAAADGRMDVVRLLLDHGADPDLEEPNGGTALLAVAGDDRVDIMTALVKAGARVDATYKTRDTLDSLMIAAQHGAMRAIRFLVAQGCDINRQSRRGLTALRCALLDRDQPEVVNTLLSLGADPTLRNRFGRTALDYAIEYGYRDSTAILGKAIARRVGQRR